MEMDGDVFLATREFAPKVKERSVLKMDPDGWHKRYRTGAGGIINFLSPQPRRSGRAELIGSNGALVAAPIADSTKCSGDFSELAEAFSVESADISFRQLKCQRV